MEKCLRKDRIYEKVLIVVKIIFILTAIFLTVMGCIHHNFYEILTPATTLLLFPGLYLVRRIFHLKGGVQLETHLYIFAYLGWTLGGAAQFYTYVPYYDKVLHLLSGVFISTLALAIFRLLERNHSREGENKATGCLFVFFASLAVAALFELCEFALSPIMHRDMQHVLDTGVTDTMLDIISCLIGTLFFMFLMIRNIHGKHDPITDAAEVFAYQNSKEYIEANKNEKAAAV